MQYIVSEGVCLCDVVLCVAGVVLSRVVWCRVLGVVLSLGLSCLVVWLVCSVCDVEWCG